MRITQAVSLAILLAWAAYAGAATIKIVALFNDKAMVRIDGVQHMLVKDKPGPEGITLLSADSKEAVLLVDGEQHTYSLSSRIGSTFSPAPDKTAVHVAPDSGGMYLVDGRINGLSIRFLVDTGASLIALNRQHARKLGIAYKLDGIPGTASTASGVTRIYQVTLDRVRVGDIELLDVPAMVHDGDHPSEALLGASFLNRLDIEREGAMMILRKP